MGVKGLWSLLMPSGRRIDVNTLEHKTLAIDMSIWLVKFASAMTDEVRARSAARRAPGLATDPPTARRRATCCRTPS